MTEGKSTDLDEVKMHWFWEQCNDGVGLSGMMMMEQAKEFHKVCIRISQWV